MVYSLRVSSVVALSHCFRARSSCFADDFFVDIESIRRLHLATNFQKQMGKDLRAGIDAACLLSDEFILKRIGYDTSEFTECTGP